MNRREKIRLTLDRIRVTKSLVGRLDEFIKLSRTAGYEPVHSMKTLAKFRSELAELRAALTRQTVSGQEEFARRKVKPYPITRKAA
jgi:hypothetical protein